MHILLVSDAWYPQINGVVRTLDTTRKIVEEKGHTFSRITPDLFDVNMPMPMYQEIGLALFWPGEVSRRIKKVIDGPRHSRYHLFTITLWQEAWSKITILRAKTERLVK